MSCRITARRTFVRRAFTVVEVLTVLAIITILFAIIAPAIEKAREHANNLICASNLRTIGAALTQYAMNNQGEYPRTRYDPAAPLCAGTNPAATNPFSPSGPSANDTTAPLFLLMRRGGVPALTFNEPYTDEMECQPDPFETTARSRSNFTDYKKNLGYSYANPYPSVAADKAGYQLTTRVSSDFALAADLNPGTGPGHNSRNHEGRGQNVLYADGRVQWAQTPMVGPGGDDIYVNQLGANEASPVSANDNVLLPTDK